MKYLFAVTVAASLLASFGTATARDGCGRGYYMNRFGECRPQPGVVVIQQPRVYVRPAPVVVVPRARARICPYGFSWRYGACRPW